MTFRVSCIALLVFRIQVDMSTLMDYLTGTREATAMLMQRLNTSKWINRTLSFSQHANQHNLCVQVYLFLIATFGQLSPPIIT